MVLEVFVASSKNNCWSSQCFKEGGSNNHQKLKSSLKLEVFVVLAVSFVKMVLLFQTPSFSTPVLCYGPISLPANPVFQETRMVKSLAWYRGHLGLKA